MDYVTLGKTGLKISRLGFGGTQSTPSGPPPCLTKKSSPIRCASW